jgi:mono/diheme cytochrome c family protein
MSARAILLLVSLCLTLQACSSTDADPALSLLTGPDTVEHGKQLVQGLAACGYCHGQAAEPNSPLIGGRTQSDVYGQVQAANITPAISGLGKWKPSEVIRALRTSRDQEGRQLSPTIHRGIEWMSDGDIRAIISYLQAVPAVEHEVSGRSLSFITRNTTGFFQSGRQVAGFIPAIDKKYEDQYGRYLVDHVARCTSCHNTPSSLLVGEKYLLGGALVKTGKGEKAAPAIDQEDDGGIGRWSKEDIVSYLKTGYTPDRRLVDPTYCPTNFYANAGDEDLNLIAKYLKSVK